MFLSHPSCVSFVKTEMACFFYSFTSTMIFCKCALSYYYKTDCISFMCKILELWLYQTECHSLKNHNFEYRSIKEWIDYRHRWDPLQFIAMAKLCARSNI